MMGCGSSAAAVARLRAGNPLWHEGVLASFRARAAKGQGRLLP